MLSPLFSGGEGEIRSLEALVERASCRFHVAYNTKLAKNPPDPCTLLHAGTIGEARLAPPSC
jgi:hypothetical protein